MLISLIRGTHDYTTVITSVIERLELLRRH
jgi:hypothetical protein